MSTVYFKRTRPAGRPELGAAALELLKKVVAESGHHFEAEVPIKAHFGERGNRTYIPAATYDPLIDYLEAQGVKPSFIETNVLYRGSRTTREDHLKLAREHGFSRIPVIIADGEIGLEYDEVVIDKDFFRSCRIGKAYGRFRQFIVTSHFKGHIAAGFGGSLKQLAMGFAARGGKLAQHTDIKPLVRAKKCIACGICAEKCDFGAITIDGIARIDPDKCAGCAGCIAVCPQAAIHNSWEGVHFPEKLAEYAYGATRGKDNLYISFLHDITEECDCVGGPMTPIMPNIGVVAGKDPVALDAACLDLVQAQGGSGIFEAGRPALVHADKIGLGSMEYELVEVS